MRRLITIAAACLAALPALAAEGGGEAEIGPDAWRALTVGKTLHYHKDGRLYGREYYDPDGKRVVFRFPNGVCAEGRWAYADSQYCFLYLDEMHCFSHFMRDGEIYVVELEEGEEQKVEKIAENEPLSCAEALDS